MFSTLNRYISKELALTFTAVSVILLVVISSKSLISLLSRVVEGKLPADVVLSLLGFGILNSAILLVPFALLVTIMLTIGRIYRDSEIYAIHSCGIGSTDLIWRAGLLIFPLVIALLYLSIVSGPWSAKQIELLKIEARSQTDIFGLVPGQFIESKHGDLVVFVEEADRKTRTVKNIFIFDRNEKSVAIETAKFANQEYLSELGGESLILREGQRYVGAPGETEFTLVFFQSHAVRIPSIRNLYDKNDPEFMSTSDLYHSDKPKHIAELQWRLSVPIAALLLSVLAFPLSVTSPRQGRFAKLGIAIVIYLIYSNLLIMAESWVASAKLPSIPGLYLVHLVMVLFIGYLIFRQRKTRLV